MHTQLGGSRVGLPSNPSSRKGSILDIAQQQQQQQQFQQQTQQQLQQYQQQQQQHHPQFQQQYQQQQQHPQQQHHQQQYQQQQHQKQQKHQLPQLPVGIGNAATSPPSDEENQQFTTRWKGSATNLRPQNTKQALSALKQASSATNVAMQGQSGSTSGSLLSVGGTDSPKQMRKGSMINLKTATGNSENTLGAPAALQRKGSVYAHTTTERGTVGSGSLQRKGSVYPGSGGGGGGWTIGGDTESPTIRKGSMFNLSITDSPTMQRKPSMASHNASTKSLSHGNNSDSLSSLTSTTVTTIATIGIDTDYGLKMGPGQIHPKGYRLTTVRHGELKMGFAKIKGVVEVEVICARNIVPVDCETPPDTYVKCYVRDGDRLRHKKKTRVVRHSAEPFYKQTLKYQSADVFGRNIVIMVWQRCVGFEHNQGLGGTEVNLDKINASQRIGGWYPLFPMHSLGGSDSDNSP